MRQLGALTLVLGAAVACAGPAAEAPPPAVPALAPGSAAGALSAERALGALDLVPRRATAAGFIDLEVLRATPWAERVVGSLERAGLGRWEQLLETDLATGVDRVVWFTVAPGAAPMPIDVLRAPTGGLVVELSRTGRQPCGPETLRAAQVETVVAPAGEMDLVRCGSLVWLSCRSCELRPAPVSSSPTRSALEALGARRPPPRLVAALVATREAYPLARCDHGVGIPLGASHSAALWLGDGLRFEGRIAAETPEWLERLERCAEDGMIEAAGILSGLPGLTRLGIPALVGRAEVSRDPTDAKSVVVTLELDAAETELMTSVLDLLAPTLR